MNYLVIYPGRFHPFHRGHRASYEYLAKKYGEDHVYIATTGVQAPVTSPFSYSDKVQMISTLGIPAGHVVKVTNPYQSREITDSIPSEEKANTVLIFALSAKDAERFNFAPKRDGSPSYLQPMPKNLKQLKPMTDHAYVEITPTVNFKVRGRDANSASQIREFYIKGNNNDRDQIIADLYGEAYPELRDIFDDRLGVTEQVQKIVREAQSIKTERSIALLESILIKERRALNEFAPGGQEGNGPFDYGSAIVQIGEDYTELYNNDGDGADAARIIKVGKTFMDAGMTAGIKAFYAMDTMVRDHVAEQLQDQGFNVRQDIYQAYKNAQTPAAPQGNETQTILSLLKEFKKTVQEPEDLATVAEIYKAFQQSLAKGFEALYNAYEFDIDANFIKFAKTRGVDLNDIADKQGLAEGESPANTLYFFDVGRGGRSFTNSDLLALGLRQSKGGRWYYKPGTNTSAEVLKSTLAQLTNRLNIAPKAWQPPATESIRDVFGFGVKKPPAKKPAAPMDDFTAKMIANKQKNLKIVQPKEIYHSPEEYAQATGNKIKESADYLEEK
jgi:hypothetical protein